MIHISRGKIKKYYIRSSVCTLDSLSTQFCFIILFLFCKKKKKSFLLWLLCIFHGIQPLKVWLNILTTMELLTWILYFVHALLFVMIVCRLRSVSVITIQFHLRTLTDYDYIYITMYIHIHYVFVCMWGGSFDIRI